MKLNTAGILPWMAGVCLHLGLGVGFYLSVHADGLEQGAPQSPRGQSIGATLSENSNIDRTLLDRYCVTCHNDRVKTGELSFTGVDPSNVETAPAIWEKVALKLRTASMPPPGRPQPDKAAVNGFVTQIEAALDRACRSHAESWCAGPSPLEPDAIHQCDSGCAQRGTGRSIGVAARRYRGRV